MGPDVKLVGGLSSRNRVVTVTTTELVPRVVPDQGGRGEAPELGLLWRGGISPDLRFRLAEVQGG